MQVYAIGEESGLHYMALEYVEGEPIDGYVQKRFVNIGQLVKGSGTPVPVMSPESFVISVRAADREVTVMSPEWSLIVTRPETCVALMSPESVLSVTGPATPLAVRLPDELEISDLVPAGTATA